ncbi:MAG: cation transporter [Chloroflexi bacterium]|nr:cation transporter [Chloroflexota bacterium]
MASITLSAPAMYADHHVLRVREALSALAGVQEVYASSAWQSVVVSYDSAKIAPAAIADALAQAGYGDQQGTPILAGEGEQYQDPAWEGAPIRATRTNEMDLKMSGEFRKY